MAAEPGDQGDTGIFDAGARRPPLPPGVGGEDDVASPERWAEASIAAGTDAEEAQAAAARTTDFYTGEPAA